MSQHIYYRYTSFFTDLSIIFLLDVRQSIQGVLKRRKPIYGDINGLKKKLSFVDGHPSSWGQPTLKSRGLNTDLSLYCSCHHHGSGSMDMKDDLEYAYNIKRLGRKFNLYNMLLNNPLRADQTLKNSLDLLNTWPLSMS